jgi:excisionase family DNA binding protein
MPFHPGTPPRPRRPQQGPPPALNTASETDAVLPDHPDQLLYTPSEAAARLRVRESWLRKKAAARAVPCTFLGKHLCFSAQDLAAIVAASAQPAAGRRPRRTSRSTPRGPDLTSGAKRRVHAPDPHDNNDRQVRACTAPAVAGRGDDRRQWELPVRVVCDEQVADDRAGDCGEHWRGE